MRVRYGQRVRLNAPHHPCHGQIGKVCSIAPGSMECNIKLFMDNGQHVWCPEESVEALKAGEGA